MNEPHDFKPQHPRPYLSAIFLTLLLLGIYTGIEIILEMIYVQVNWNENRCKPHYMIFSGLFGHNINENYEFCLNKQIDKSTQGITAPITSGIKQQTKTTKELNESANSIGSTLGSLTSGISSIIGDFGSRITTLMGRVKLSASRMKVMMNRVYGTMFSIVYM